MLWLFCRLSAVRRGIIVRRDDAAAGNFESVHNHKPARGDDFRMDVKGDRAFGAQESIRPLRCGRRRFPAREMVSSVEESMMRSMESICAFDFLGGQLEFVGLARE